MLTFLIFTAKDKKEHLFFLKGSNILLKNVSLIQFLLRLFIRAGTFALACGPSPGCPFGMHCAERFFNCRSQIFFHRLTFIQEGFDMGRTASSGKPLFTRFLDRCNVEKNRTGGRGIVHRADIPKFLSNGVAAAPTDYLLIRDSVLWSSITVFQTENGRASSRKTQRMRARPGICPIRFRCAPAI